MRRRTDESHLSAYVDEMLSGPEMRTVAAEARLDESTAAKLAHLRQVVQALREAPEPSPPADFWPQVYRRVRQVALAEARRSRWRRTLATAGGSLLLVAALAALAKWLLRLG
ncbi:MAG: hypothetical protein IT204_24865 [Fimbriimonadaceae bacterium]|nr:hypothetical protein [Fimbriimonadaceae bacterium]